MLRLEDSQTESPGWGFGDATHTPRMGFLVS